MARLHDGHHRLRPPRRAERVPRRAAQSDGAWNAAHFKNPNTTAWSTEYAAALDVDAQRAAAEKIQELLLDETPMIFPYFYYFLTATKKNVGRRQ